MARPWLSRLVVALAVVFGVVAGAFLNRWPTWSTTRHSFCTLCALHREDAERTPILGRHRTQGERGGILHELLASPVGNHQHVWSTPAYVFPTYPTPKLLPRDAFTQAVAEAEVHDLEALESNPHAIAILDEAMRNDRGRTLRFLQKVLDPQAYVPIEAIGLLDRKGTWEERWAVVDAFFGAYHCDVTDTSASCRLRAGSTDLLVLVRTATSDHSGGIDWKTWTKVATTSGAPATYAAVTLND
ncbi:MAG: hypothetical protein ACXWUG_14920 [Polyangiales bacterium]